jgi:hypothetical protein
LAWARDPSTVLQKGVWGRLLALLQTTGWKPGAWHMHDTWRAGCRCFLDDEEAEKFAAALPQVCQGFSPAKLSETLGEGDWQRTLMLMSQRASQGGFRIHCSSLETLIGDND